MVDPVPFVNSNAFASIALTDQYLREVYLGKGRVSEGKNIVFLQCVDSLRVPCITTQRCVRHAVFLTDTPQLCQTRIAHQVPALFCCAPTPDDGLLDEDAPVEVRNTGIGCGQVWVISRCGQVDAVK